MRMLEEMYQESPTKTKTRMKIVEVSAQHFSDVGIDVVAMTDIAQSCDITIRNLYRYYPSKEFLVVDVAYYFFHKVTKFEDYKVTHFDKGIDQLEYILNMIYEMDQSDSAGLSLIKFVMYFDLYIYNMDKTHPAYIKYTEDYILHIQELGIHELEAAMIKGLEDGSIDLKDAELAITLEYIMQSLFSIIMRTLIKESENRKINSELVTQHIKMIISYYRRQGE